MSDLRAERRAYAAAIYAGYIASRDPHGTYAHAYAHADAIIQHDLENPPAWSDVKDSLTTGWVKSSDRLPTEADAPSGRVWVVEHGRAAPLSIGNIAAPCWKYWHPATGIYQIPEPPR